MGCMPNQGQHCIQQGLLLQQSPLTLAVAFRFAVLLHAAILLLLLFAWLTPGLD